MPKKTPTRTCIACGSSGGKRGFARVVRTPQGEVVLDPSGKLAGRGAYLCRDAACFEKAAKKRLLDARLRCKVGEGDYQRLEDEFRAALDLGDEAR